MLIRGCLFCLLGASFFSDVGCTTTLTPPTAPSHPTTILLTDYGKHSSLLLPDPHGGLVEYAFGDWDYFALGHKSLFVGFIALIHSPQSTLGRRWVLIDVNSPHTSELLGTERAQRLIVDADRAEALRNHLNLDYARHPDPEVFNANEHMHFVHCDEPYNLFHNCNNVTADWLKSLGVEIHGPALFSNFRIEPSSQPANTK